MEDHSEPQRPLAVDLPEGRCAGDGWLAERLAGDAQPPCSFAPRGAPGLNVKKINNNSGRVMSNERFKIISFTDEEFRAATGHDVEPPDFWDEWEITTRDFIDPDPDDYLN
jgi:hypothetical protein